MKMLEEIYANSEVVREWTNAMRVDDGIYDNVGTLKHSTSNWFGTLCLGKNIETHTHTRVFWLLKSEGSVYLGAYSIDD